MRRKGFTLIELLVVIGIIAILAAILFPVFAQARDKARQASCLSNCKQLALAVSMYVQDYDETFFWQAGWDQQIDFGPGFWGSSYRTYVRWPFAHLPYVKSQAVYKCPSDKLQNRGFAAAPGASNAVPWWASIGANLGIFHRGTGNAAAPAASGGVTMAMITRPAEKLVMAEAYIPYGFEPNSAEYFRAANFTNRGENGWTPFSRFRQTVCAAQALNLPDSQMGVVTRHSMGNIAIFCDGHAKWLRWNQIGDSFTSSCPNAGPNGTSPTKRQWRLLVDPVLE